MTSNHFITLDRKLEVRALFFFIYFSPLFIFFVFIHSTDIGCLLCTRYCSRHWGRKDKNSCLYEAYILER